MTSVHVDIIIHYSHLSTQMSNIIIVANVPPLSRFVFTSCRDNKNKTYMICPCLCRSELSPTMLCENGLIITATWEHTYLLIYDYTHTPETWWVRPLGITILHCQCHGYTWTSSPTAMECQNVIKLQMEQTRDETKTLFHNNNHGVFILM